MLLILAAALVFALGRVPQDEWNGQRRQSHDGEGNPVKEVGGETLVVLVQVDNAALSRLRADGQLELQEEKKKKICDTKNLEKAVSSVCLTVSASSTGL